jgi:hypothetical protein
MATRIWGEGRERERESKDGHKVSYNQSIFTCVDDIEYERGAVASSGVIGSA